MINDAITLGSFMADLMEWYCKLVEADHLQDYEIDRNYEKLNVRQMLIDDAIAEMTPDEFKRAEAKFNKDYELYQLMLAEALEEDPWMTYPEADLKIGPAPWPAPVGPNSARRPGSVFEAMILRIAPYTLRGVIFYQGEADTDGHQKEYGSVFKSMIKEWREVFFDDQLPLMLKF